MKVIEIDERFKDLWDEIAGKEKVGSFLQSYAWGEFKKSLNKKVFRLIVSDIKTDIKEPLVSHFKILAQAQVIKEEIPIFGPFLYIPHGPIFNTNLKEKVFGVLSQKLIQIAKNENCFMIRMEPKEDLDFAPGLCHFKSSIQAIYTLKVDLTPSLEEIFSSFKKSTRYDIRMSEKKGVKVEIGSEKDLDSFLKLLKETAERAKFEIYPDDYLRKMYFELHKENMVELILAKVKDRIVGAFMIIYFGGESTYLHSAADREFFSYRVSQALMWETIKISKEKGCKKLDLWGVSPENEINHPWYGFTRFKRGFAPKEPISSYPGSYFLVLKPIRFRLYLWQKFLRNREV